MSQYASVFASELRTGMRTTFTGVFIAIMSLCGASAAAAQDHGSVSFVTGFSMSNGSSIADALASLSPGVNDRINLGGRIAVNIVPGLQAVGEIGRIGNVLPSLTTSILAFSPIGVRASAFYGEGGVRAFAGTRSAVNPYIEATGGLARLNIRVDGVNATASDLIQLGLGFVDRTSPSAGLGAGVMLHAGKLTMDAGYRYKKIFSGDFVTTLVGAGNQLTSHQAVFGIGVRF
jgi:opacity protein-like surface antigen